MSLIKEKLCPECNSILIVAGEDDLEPGDIISCKNKECFIEFEILTIKDTGDVELIEFESSEEDVEDEEEDDIFEDESVD